MLFTHPHPTVFTQVIPVQILIQWDCICYWHKSLDRFGLELHKIDKQILYIMWHDAIWIYFSSTGTTWDAGQQERDFIRAVIPHLRNGIENFKVLATILLDYDESKKRALQQVTLQGQRSLDLADSAASAQLSAVDQYTESLTAMKGQLDQQQRDKSKDLESLKTERQSIADCMETCRAALDDSRRSLDSAQETLKDLERKRENSETTRNVGIVLMFTIIGTIPGELLWKNNVSVTVGTLQTQTQQIPVGRAMAQGRAACHFY